MAWDDEMPTVLRTLILDTSATPLYTDDQLANLILVSSLGLLAEVSFPYAFVVSILNSTIIPDPTVTPTRDISFINLACLKAAARLTAAEIRDLTRQGIEIQDGTSRIKLQRSPLSLKLLRDTYQQEYEDALYAYKTGGNDGLGEAIVSPYKYWSNWSSLGMAGMFDGYPVDRMGPSNMGGFF